MRVLSVLLALTLTACVPAGGAIGDSAEQVAATVAARVYPGMSTGAFANCVRDNATNEELRTLSRYAGRVGGPAQVLVLDIANRAETRACLAANGITIGDR